MLSRCYKEQDKDYKNYGARGIGVSIVWRESFAHFWADMGSSYQKGLTLGRIDNDKGYSVENCRWETQEQQHNNTRKNQYIDTPKGRLTVAQAARTFNIKPVTLYARINRYHWDIHKALTHPV